MIEFFELFDAGFFNPFRGMTESKAHPHARTLRTPLNIKFKDMYHAVFGSLRFKEFTSIYTAYKDAKQAGDQNATHMVKQKLFQITQKSHLGMVDLIMFIPFLFGLIFFLSLTLLGALIFTGQLELYHKFKSLGVLTGLIIYPTIVIGAIAGIIAASAIIVAYLTAKLIVASSVSAVFAIIPLIVHGIARLAGAKYRIAMKELPIETFQDANNLTMSDSEKQNKIKQNVSKLLKKPDIFDHCKLKMPDTNGATQLQKDGYLAIYKNETKHDQNPDLIIRFNQLIQKKTGSIALFRFNFFNISLEDESPTTNRMKARTEASLRDEHKDLYDPEIRKTYLLDQPVHRPKYISRIFKQHGIVHHKTTSKVTEPSIRPK